MIPGIVVIMVIIGSVARAVWGWLQSGEPFVKRKFAATDPIFAWALEACAAANCTIDAYIKSPWD